MEVKNGLRQVAEALNFCHRDARLYHLGVDPSTIMLLPTGDWKLCGFNFSASVGHKGEVVEHKLDYQKFGSELPMIGLPSFAYVAPEVALEGTCDHKADTFALAKVAMELHRLLHEVGYEKEGRGRRGRGVWCGHDLRRIALTPRTGA